MAAPTAGQCDRGTWMVAVRAAQGAGLHWSRPSATAPETVPDDAFAPPAQEVASVVHRWGGWPLALLYLGFPVWWFCGLANFIFPLMAVPMAIRLFRSRPVRLPTGFALWALFLLWMVAGVVVLQIDAPGAIGGSGGIGRYLTFGYRVLLYLSATIALLYVGNLGERELSAQRISRLLAYMFVVTTIGGLVGALLPQIEFRSLLQILLPHSLSANAFLDSLIRTRTSEVQTVLGYAESRPVAPFNYANTWGANFSFCLPFFILAWCGPGAGWRRWFAPVILIASTVPIVYSLNRGLWAAIAVGFLYAVVMIALSGRTWVAQALLATVVIGALLFFFSPLQSIVAERLAHPHSNARRGQLLQLTVSSVLHGSPVVGFGTTRNVQGSFASIAGGSSASCGGCGVPAMGTQGTMWSILFNNGVVGAGLFLSFFAVRFVRHWRGRAPYELAAVVVLVMAATEIFVYDFIGPPLFIIMICVGLMWRHEQAAEMPWLAPG